MNRRSKYLGGFGLPPVSHLNSAADMVEESRRAREKISSSMDKGNCVNAFRWFRTAEEYLGKARSEVYSVLTDPSAMPGEKHEAERLEKEVRRAETRLDISSVYFESRCILK